MFKMKKIAGVASTTAGTDTKLYTAVALKQASGILFIANTGVATTYRVSLETTGGSAMAQYLAFDIDIDTGDFHSIEGISTYNLQELWVRSASGDVAFTFVGSEEV